MNLDNFQSKEEVWKLLEAITDSLYNCVIAINTDGEIILINKASEELLDISKDKALGMKIKELLPETKLLEVLDKNKKRTNRSLELKKQGKKIYTHRTPIVYNDQLVGAIAIFEEFNDIAEVKNELRNTSNDIQVLDTM